MQQLYWEDIWSNISKSKGNRFRPGEFNCDSVISSGAWMALQRHPQMEARPLHAHTDQSLYPGCHQEVYLTFDGSTLCNDG